MSQAVFNTMLAKDKIVYANIIKSKAMITKSKDILNSYKLGDRKILKDGAAFTAFASNLNKNILIYNELVKSYQARQNDYKTNKAYSLSKYITSATDSVTKYLSNLWNSIPGLGVDPLFTPIVIVSGVVISVTVIAYFITKYQESTTVDYDKSIAVAAELAKDNPVLANKLLDELSKAQNKQTESGLFSQVGTGVKYALGIAAVGGVIYSVTYLVNKK